MRLGDHFQQIKKKYNDIFFSGICFDHRQFKKNYIFFAIKGKNNDGNKFIVEALKKGASIIVSDKLRHRINNKNIIVWIQYLKELLAQLLRSLQLIKIISSR